MKHMDRTEAQIARLLRRARTIAIIGASPRPSRHSHAVTGYLHKTGYDVVPVRPDRMQVVDLPTYGRLEDVPGPVEVVVIFRRPDAGVVHVREAAAKRAEAVWFQPGTWSREAEEEATRHELTIIKDRCIMEDHRHVLGALGEAGSGHPKKTGVRFKRKSA
jgi:uncharacterized protein